MQRHMQAPWRSMALLSVQAQQRHMLDLLSGLQALVPVVRKQRALVPLLLKLVPMPVWLLLVQLPEQG